MKKVTLPGMSLKEEVNYRCLQILNEKVVSLQKILLDLQHSAANETKSTAGDKHETALAMLQIEQENTSRQLQVLLGQRLQLNQIDLSIKANIIGKGSLIYTNRGMIFIATGLGKVQMENNFCLVISPASPLGISLLGKKVADTAQCNGIAYCIDRIE